VLGLRDPPGSVAVLDQLEGVGEGGTALSIHAIVGTKTL
jgi:hypothetical protein